jgi:hypothetical protein
MMKGHNIETWHFCTGIFSNGEVKGKYGFLEYATLWKICLCKMMPYFLHYSKKIVNYCGTKKERRLNITQTLFDVLVSS